MRTAVIRNRHSLRWKLVSLGIAALLPGFAVVAVTQYQITRSRRAEVQALALRSAVQASFEIERIIAGIESLLVAVSSVPAVSRLEAAECSAYLAHLQSRLPHLTGIFVIDTDGQ